MRLNEYSSKRPLPTFASKYVQKWGEYFRELTVHTFHGKPRQGNYVDSTVRSVSWPYFINLPCQSSMKLDTRLPHACT